jgi:hypothetical protein
MTAVSVILYMLNGRKAKYLRVHQLRAKHIRKAKDDFIFGVVAPWCGNVTIYA